MHHQNIQRRTCDRTTLFAMQYIRKLKAPSWLSHSTNHQYVYLQRLLIYEVNISNNIPLLTLFTILCHWDVSSFYKIQIAYFQDICS